MRTQTGYSVAVLLSLITMTGCGEEQGPVGVADTPPLQAFTAPTAVPIEAEFTGLNPCSGEEHTVSFTGTAWIHQDDGRVLVRSMRTITTRSGFTGRGTDTVVGNGEVVKLTLNDMLAHPSGDRIRAHLVLVVDVSTGTVRVMKGTFDQTVCVTN